MRRDRLSSGRAWRPAGAPRPSWRPRPRGRPARCCAPGAAAGLLTPQRVPGRRATRQTRRCPHTARREAPTGVGLALRLPVPGWADRRARGLSQGKPRAWPLHVLPAWGPLVVYGFCQGIERSEVRVLGVPGEKRRPLLRKKTFLVECSLQRRPSSWPLCKEACH